MSIADEILKKYEDEYEYHFHKVDREFILKAMAEYTTECVKASLERASQDAIVDYENKVVEESIDNSENIILL